MVDAAPDLGTSDRFYDAKASVYSDFENWDLLHVVRQVLPDGGSVLDVGCGSGGLLERLPVTSRRVGLEISPVAAVAARDRCDEVIVAGVLDPDVGLGEGAFDVVICGDVIEHIGDTSAALARVGDWLAPGGSLVVSVPNIANWQSRLRLLKGVWRYEESGIWDSGHVRFFTMETIRSQLGRQGFDVESLTTTQALSHQLPRLRRTPRAVRFVVEEGLRRLARKRPALFGFQLILVARRPHATVPIADKRVEGDASGT